MDHDWRIYKYPLAITDKQMLELPAGSKPLTVMVQNGQLCLRVLVNTTAPKCQWAGYVIGTGNPATIAPVVEYVGSVIDGAFVWHVFLD